MMQRRVLRGFAVALAIGVCAAVAGSVPAYATDASATVSIEVSESIIATDGPAVTPPATISIDEAVAASDGLVTLPPVLIDITESVAESDDARVIPPALLNASESVGVGDTVTVTLAPMVQVNESVGLIDTVSIEILDSTPPTTVISFPANGGLYNASAWSAGCWTAGFCGTSADNPGGTGVRKVEVSFKQGGSWWSGSAFDSTTETYFTATGTATWAYAFPLYNLPDGTYTLHARATDNNGNAEAGPTATFTIDTTPPHTIIDAGPSGAVSSTSATFMFHATEVGSTLKCSIDGSSYSSCDSTTSQTYAALAEGSHTFRVRATDPAGNTDPTPAERTWTVDTVPSDTVIDSGPISVTHDTAAMFTFHATESGSSFKCLLDTGTFTTCVSGQSYTTLGLGAHTFRVEAVDGAGNIDPTPATWSWSIHATTSLLYNGGQIAIIGNTFKAAALLSSSATLCTSSQPISFASDRNPVNGSVGTYALPGATTDRSGQATSAAIGTSSWMEGVYTITATYPGTTGCDAATDSATLTVASPGDSASGGGWYTLSGSGRVNFGFTVKKQSDGSYKGQFLLINNGKWRLKGTLTSYVKSSNQEAVGGAGDLLYWDQSANGGLGAWALSQSNTTFTASFTDNGSGSKGSADTFGLHIDHAVHSPPEPASLPNSSPVAIKGGDVRAT